MSLADGLRWWRDKPALVPAGMRDLPVMLHNGGDVATSDDHRGGPSLGYVLPGREFRHLEDDGRFERAVAAGAVYVRNYFVDAGMAPTETSVSRRVRIRGRNGWLRQAGDVLRQVEWSIPAGPGRAYVWIVVDSPKHRSERELIAFIESLQAVGSPRV